MAGRALGFSDRAYRQLAQAYPPAFRQRFGEEMAQVFRWQCKEAYQQARAWGLLRLWFSAAWDWAWTAAYQWFLYFTRKGRYPMNTTALDRQMGDLIWSMSCGLRAGYSLRQVFEALAQDAPEPARSACQKILEELEKGISMEGAIQNWKASLTSPALGRLADLLLRHRQVGGNLADMLDPLGEELLKECGSDAAFYESMRKEAEMLGAQVPERAKTL